ncbi:MAG: Fumarate reductase iron-sulfur subunit [Fimbriimonadales bacterium]|nr:MAG: succinate dehydrogenase/fumarate reductase iron-sulfur subunit [Armatimonadota bacterium]MBV6502031.1 Fumarate reductase iron-sulfur subunit [Fimbriimonadales bacterium]MCE7898866.1 succinate dehydrogenase/fumarate reductase iron-sulfur subunit [Armatimonadetes bacterium ATM1]MDL1928930.1 succinate dehydrogenase/fumarate reductase iron-sulfur subunit [Fimbriimonadia bacterium ATM]MBC6969597.1 succinate dehydrogenase/fumarate reductase iron-sulfur subunit [Armatimonadota bacterium]
MSKITLSVYRGDANGGEMKTYTVDTFPGMVVLDAIHQIQAEQDGTLACRWNCKAAKCGSCSAEVNGMPKLMCKTRVDDYPADQPIVVHPLRTFPIVKDLVADVSWNFEVSKSIPILKLADDGSAEPLRMQQVDVDRIQEFRKCIECFLCQTVCHVLRDGDRKDIFFGPRQMVRLASLEMHPLDVLDRRPMLRETAGVGICNITKCCTEVCPEHIHITDNAIIPLKERVADTYFDPVQKVLRWVGGRK